MFIAESQHVTPHIRRQQGMFWVGIEGDHLAISTVHAQHLAVIAIDNYPISHSFKYSFKLNATRCRFAFGAMQLFFELFMSAMLLFPHFNFTFDALRIGTEKVD